jgi:hypothetical protein
MGPDLKSKLACARILRQKTGRPFSRMKQKFKAQLVAHGPKDAWTFMSIPFDVPKVFGSKARVAVAGTMNGFAFRTSIFPEGDGTHAMAVSKALQAGAKARPGDTVVVTMDIDKAERIVAVPPELQQLLKNHAKAAATFEALAYSHRKEYADWIAGAKRPETKEARLKKALEMLLAGRKIVR